jgi:hypothetical protein
MTRPIPASEGPVHHESFRVGLGCGLSAAVEIARRHGDHYIANAIKKYETETTNLDEYFGVAKDNIPASEGEA